MNPINFVSSLNSTGVVTDTNKVSSFSLEEITDKKMGLIQCSCASNCGKINFDDVA